ncbi:hypothetical protein KY290_005532 [Solanum tuberosum]|uniref:Uncharacterized protein n=1 Tax=Solanum tuberosum TaxID=4113 RepID=A0ABQ7WEU4_SOLTU|nr:hypothetical protein KY289_005921 [Solanum tuberosum]KAH0779105.1 hypothetical protein KY290_005532 [Solanum tuberosum]
MRGRGEYGRCRVVGRDFRICWDLNVACRLFGRKKKQGSVTGKNKWAGSVIKSGLGMEWGCWNLGLAEGNGNKNWTKCDGPPEFTNRAHVNSSQMD